MIINISKSDSNNIKTFGNGYVKKDNNNFSANTNEKLLLTDNFNNTTYIGTYLNSDTDNYDIKFLYKSANFATAASNMKARAANNTAPNSTNFSMEVNKNFELTDKDFKFGFSAHSNASMDGGSGGLRNRHF